MVAWIKMKHGTKVGLGPGHIVLDKYSAPPTGAQSPPTFGPCLFWLNGWMDQDATWYRGRPLPRRHCVRWRTQLAPEKGHSPPTFWPMSVVAKWLDGSRCHSLRVRPRPRWHCVTWGTQLAPKKGHSLHFSANVYCGHTDTCIRMPLGTKVGLGPGHIIRWGPSSPHAKKGAHAPNFCAVSFVTKRLAISATDEHLFCFFCRKHIVYSQDWCLASFTVFNNC